MSSLEHSYTFCYMCYVQWLSILTLLVNVYVDLMVRQ